MTIEELVREDKSFNRELFISKANNMVKRIYTAITLNELEKVDHFISDNVYNKFSDQIKNAEEKNCRLIYEEVNVNTKITDIKKEQDTYKIYTDAEVKCLRYFKSKDNDIIVGGSPNSRIVLNNKIVFKKKINNTDLLTNRCRGCGTTYNVNYSGICPICGRVYDLEEIDYYIDEFE